jgi:hypothetical protein
MDGGGESPVGRIRLEDFLLQITITNQIRNSESGTAGHHH